MKNLAVRVGTYIPTICGGGAFEYHGGRLSGSVAAVGVYKINAADTRNGTSHGVFTDIAFGEAMQGGYGRAVYDDRSIEHFFFGGVGGDVFGLGVNGGVYVSHVEGGGTQIGTNLDASVPGAGAGVGMGENIDSLRSCIQHHFR